MPIQYRIDRAAGIIEETWSGTITIGDLREYWRGYLADPEVLALRRTIADLREADIAFTGGELDALVQTLVIPILGDREWKTAIVVSRPAQFGVGRQYQVYAEQYSHDAIFDDPHKAKAWLSAPKETS
jgi:hypothetical protein